MNDTSPWMNPELESFRDAVRHSRKDRISAMSQVAETMTSINNLSRKIVDITGVTVGNRRQHAAQCGDNLMSPASVFATIH